jgi:diguanylate cyclase (GGDEF)-like protein
MSWEMEGGGRRTNALLDGTRHTSGLTSRLILNYVEREAGPRGVKAVLERCGLTDQEERLRNPAFWFDFETKLTLFEATGAVLGRPDAARRIGQAAIELQSLSGLKVALRAFGSPRLAYGALPGVTGRFTRAHRAEVLELGDDHARFRYFDVSGVGYHSLDCEYTTGLLACIPTMFGVLPARVGHPECALKGASECVYDLQWERYRSPLARGATGLAGAVAAGLSAGLPRGRRALARPFQPIAAARHTLLAPRQRQRSLEASVRDQEEVAERLSSSLLDLVSDLRTDEVLRKIMDNAQAALLGREVAVLVFSGDQVQAHGSPGVATESLGSLERWAMTTSESLEYARTLPNLEKVPELADLARHPTKPLGALSVAPLVFRGSQLGALIALALGSDSFLPKETALLEVYAAEAAIALANARLVERLEETARRDSLTGLVNHGEFQNTLGVELESAQRRQETLSVAMLDLDGFKEVNDEYGHAEGDRLLRMVAQRIDAACTSRDIAARIGGDEFALILPGRGAVEAETLAAALEQELESLGVGTGASWGVAAWPTAGPSQSLLLFNADRALYEAKLAKRAEAERRSTRRRSDSGLIPADPSLNAIQHRRALTASLARAVDAKDSYTRSHSETVAELCAAVGQEIELDPQRVLKLRLAGLLHDVGKIGIADAILQKPAALTEKEYEVMKTHATLGHSILYAAELFDESQWVLHHHERIDGRGYPDGLGGEDIRLESRIILVADAFEAMTSDRAYRRGRPESDALAELRRGAGAQFDVDCVGALARVLARGPRSLTGLGLAGRGSRTA